MYEDVSKYIDYRAKDMSHCTDYKPKICISICISRGLKKCEIMAKISQLLIELFQIKLAWNGWFKINN